MRVHKTRGQAAVQLILLPPAVRKPFDGANTTCYLAQFFNAVYVMNGDASNPSAVYIYDAGAKSWSTQSVTTGTFDPSSFNAILDHDTNVFYALSKGEVFFLDLGSLKVANTTALPWVDVGKSPYPATYEPVMALAQNHIHFLDVPGTPAGDADIFVIHFSFFQPDPQSYPLPDGSAFPATHGQASSFFQESAVQQEFAFIPDDGSNTYVINVETNTTQSLAGPSTKDAKAMYAASITALVQLDSTGAVSFLPYTQGDASTNAQAKWTSVANVAAVAPPGSSSSSSNSSASGSNSPSKSSASGVKTGASGSSPTQSAGASQQIGGALSTSSGLTGFAMIVAGMLSVLGMTL
ncbi:hypothetical protein EW026_g5343 [Hermanssonia centrifuga]|uniref:Uncharacterized protein n=1 Tax=Hermanssonia centrifuga TaxID=98765 RepID=A0A4S4KIR2_9APHY|nr:hypothetical protein EW026_g5343 [Hermanssonia centrifuga]